MSESDPRFVTCHCQHCGKGIEFDAAELTPDNNIVPCPHCGSETVLSAPDVESPRQTEPQPQSTGLNPDLWRDLPRTDDAESAPRELHGAATPKQIAYLTYMGVKNAHSLTKQQAHNLIESNRFFPEPNSLAEFERQRAYQADWQTKRLILHPDIYISELKEFLNDTLPEQLHSYVRGQIVGASERLTKSKIRDAVVALTDEDAYWWHQPDHEAVFLEHLRQMYPSCCDGHSPNPTPKRVKARAVYSPTQPAARPVKGSGCLVLLSFVFLFVLLCLLLVPR